MTKYKPVEQDQKRHVSPGTMTVNRSAQSSKLSGLLHSLADSNGGLLAPKGKNKQTKVESLHRTSRALLLARYSTTRDMQVTETDKAIKTSADFTSQQTHSNGLIPAVKSVNHTGGLQKNERNKLILVRAPCISVNCWGPQNSLPFTDSSRGLLAPPSHAG